MALIRWEPTRELQSVQGEINRLFNTLFDAPVPAGGQSAAPRRWVPAMDLVEREHDYVLRADLPGLGEDDVKIEFEHNVLTVSGERRASREENSHGVHRVERSYGSFARSLTLPEGVDPQAVTASFDRGVLEISVPKPVERQPQRISISVGRPAETETQPASDSAPAEPVAA
jgi:HSP20 family protein